MSQIPIPHKTSLSVDSIDQAWFASVQSVVTYGSWYHDNSCPILELMGLSLQISNPAQICPLIKEVADIEVLERMLYKFKPGAKLPKAPFTYGSRLYNQLGIDQVEWAVNRLKKKPETKSATITLLIPGEEAAHIPCLISVDFKLRYGKLNLNFFFRSQNIFGRQYANLIALRELQLDVSEKLKVELGLLSGYICSAHIYGFDLEDAKKLIKGSRRRIDDNYRKIGPDI